MDTNSRLRTLSLLTMFFIGACTTTEAKDGGAGGTSGGSGGAGGAGVGGGSAGGALGTACMPPAQVITDFTFEPDGGSTTEAKFGNATTFSGGAGFVYPDTAITSDVTGGNWRIKGNVADYSGFGISFYNCNVLDASAFKGITFKLSGTLPSPNTLTIGMGTVGNNITADWLTAHGETGTEFSPGRCTPPATATLNKYSQSTCAEATKALPAVSATATTVTVLWSDFTGGKPVAGVTPSEITSIYWRFSWAAGATAYDVDITIDDLAFIP